ncbi:MAG: DUF1002 domain-containing protein [Clostridium sp.]|uniref:DUF1002 domain-containing protein n=1 Tax=Clostridium sp. TaxID=1506 RepID=UPI002FC98225
MKKSLKLFVTILTMAIFILPLTSKLAFADSFKVVTLGADLSNEQKQQMLKHFGVTKKDANILEVTKKEEDKYLKDIATAKQIGTKSISCSYVEPTSSGGLDVTTENIHWVTDGMIKNALITAGVENAVVKASAPFNVSGTAALTGILKGFENSKGGEKISEDKKEAANEEIVVTGNLGDKIGQDEAANLINEVKTEVLKANPQTEEEIKNIIVNVINNNNINLSAEEIDKITGLMDKINALDIDFNKIKDQLNEVSNVLKDTLNSDEAQGFFASVKEFFSNFTNWINSLFN